MYYNQLNRLFAYFLRTINTTKTSAYKPTPMLIFFPSPIYYIIN